MRVSERLLNGCLSVLISPRYRIARLWPFIFPKAIECYFPTTAHHAESLLCLTSGIALSISDPHAGYKALICKSGGADSLIGLRLWPSVTVDRQGRKGTGRGGGGLPGQTSGKPWQTPANLAGAAFGSLPAKFTF